MSSDVPLRDAAELSADWTACHWAGTVLGLADAELLDLMRRVDLIDADGAPAAKAVQAGIVVSVEARVLPIRWNLPELVALIRRDAALPVPKAARTRRKAA